MRRTSLAASGLLAALLTAGAAGARTADRVVGSPDGVTAVARAGATIAFASPPALGDCDRVRLWSLGTRAVTRLGARRPYGDATSTGRGIAGLAVGGSRALWITYVGGNIREWSLWTATTSARTPRLVRFVARDVDGPQPLVVGGSTRGLLPWALDATVTGVRADGSRAFRTALTAPVRALASGAGRIAALLADGHVVVLTSSGEVVDEYAYEPGEAHAIRLGAVGVFVQLRSGALELRGRRVARTYQLPPAATLLDFAEGVVLYALGQDLHVRRLSTGKDVVLRTASLPARAALDASGLVFVNGWHVRHVATATIAAALAG